MRPSAYERDQDIKCILLLFVLLMVHTFFCIQGNHLCHFPHFLSIAYDKNRWCDRLFSLNQYSHGNYRCVLCENLKIIRPDKNASDYKQWENETSWFFFKGFRHWKHPWSWNNCGKYTQNYLTVFKIKQ